MRIFGTISYPVPQAERPPLFRVLHELELPPHLRHTPLKMPEVRPTFPNQFCDFGRDAQLLSKSMNPLFSPDKWSVVYDDTLWVTNRQGFGNPDDPRANYVTGKNLMYDDPKLEALTTGGSCHTGYIVGDTFYVESLHYENVPSLEWILARPWFWVYAITMDSHLKPRPFPQGIQPNGENVLFKHPFFTNTVRYVATMPKWTVVPWTGEGMPDPLKIYNPY